MKYSEPTSFVKRVLQFERLVSGLHTKRRSQDDGEEREHLIDGESIVQESLHRQSLPPQLEVMSSPASYLDDVTPLQRYAQIARDLRPSLPSTCCWLGPEDVKLIGKHPIAAGKFSNIWEATHNGRKAVLKAYRCYVSFDVAQVASVRCKYDLR